MTPFSTEPAPTCSSTPIQPLEAGGYRDTLVLTLRAGGFQGEGVA
jgi:hypothetical protein